MAITDNRLHIHLIGGSKGESIVLQLPTGEWGVVDCYARSLSDKQRNDTYRFLAERSINRLAFLCLTHPHDDHFYGMSQLLREFEVDSFWRPSVMTGHRLQQILELELTDAELSGVDRFKRSANELCDIFELVKAKRAVGSKPAIPRAAALGSLLYPVPLGADGDLKITAIAPSTRQTEKYEAGLSKCFIGNAFVKAALQGEHNRISLALLVEFGETRIVLGGDVERDGWREVLEEYDNDKLSVHAVKVSHHGSKTGYCSDLWSVFAKGGKPLSFLTGYRRFRLPDREAVDHIRQFARKICIAGDSSGRTHDSGVHVSSGAEPRSRIALREKLKLRPIRPATVGTWSFCFDNKGNCVDESFSGITSSI